MKPLTFTIQDFQTPAALERLFRRLNQTLAEPPLPPLKPDLKALAASLAPLIRAQLQASGGSPLNLQSLLPSTGLGTIIPDTHANRITLYTPPGATGIGFVETDRHVLYVSVESSGILVWQYAGGTYTAAIASRPSDLAITDAGFHFVSTTADQETDYVWTGTEWVTVGGYLQEMMDAATNAITTLMVLRHLTTGTAAAGFGGGEVTQLENDANTAVTALYRTVEWAVATGGAESSLYKLHLIVAGVLTEILRVFGVGGHLQLAVAGSRLRFEGATNAFPAFTRGAGTANTRSILADGSASTGHEVADEAYGAGWNGSVEVPTKNAVYDKVEAVVASIPSVPTLASGIYTPTLTNVANLGASTAYECQYLRVGSTVFVAGRVDVDPTLAATSTQLGISLPVASTLGAIEDVGGTAFASGIAGQGAAILGDVANARAQMQWISGDITNQAMYFSFGYQVI